MFKIELATQKDSKNVFELANDPIVRKSSFKPRVISWKEHQEWFRKKIEDNDSIYFVIKSAKNQFIGQVRFDRVDQEKNTYVIGVSLHADFRGKGLAQSVLLRAAQKLYFDFRVDKIYAYIKKDNKRSLHCFCKVGYEIQSEEMINGYDAYKLCYIMKKEKTDERNFDF